ncbi:Uncharacterised protein [Mycobacteroides abscessus subsp. abscessus]|nr:Uncharacterised protein [Mycobacteroides abscessus subsp. abscessus]
MNVRLHPFVEPELCVARLELARRAAVPIGAENEAEPALTPPSAGRVAPQLRNTDPNVAKQSAQQW